ncbi:hypothetical protein Ga0100231_016105 [Opitutaceae bacterium TAV4]|nr:hypothetical protein Ga0100231_016105 [Opitutaceae bacterium TAV4]
MSGPPDDPPPPPPPPPPLLLLNNNTRTMSASPLTTLSVAAALCLPCLAPAATLSAQDTPAATLEWQLPRVGAPFTIIGSHARQPSIVIEALDADDILTESARAKGRFQVRISNPDTEQNTAARSLTLRLTVRIPDATGLKKIPLTGDAASVTSEIAPGQTRIIDFPFSISPSLWKTLCQRTAGFGMSALDFVVTATDTQTTAAITPLVDIAHMLYAPPRNAPLPPPRATVRMRNGVPVLEINGREEPSNFAYIGWNWGVSRDTIRDFAASGRHLYKIVFQPWSVWRDGRLDPARFEKRMNALVASIVGNDPQALIYIVWWMHTPKDWADHHPGETAVYDNGSDRMPNPQPNVNGWRMPSLFSKVWRDEQDSIMREETRRILDGAYADRIFGANAGYGNGGEWNGFGYHGGLFSDYSAPARREFAAWLSSENRYASIAELNASWKTNYTDWSEIEIPTRAQRLSAGWGSFTGPDFPAAVTDYHRFVTDYTVSQIEHFGKLFKDATNGRWLVGHYYGYFAGHLAYPPYHTTDAGHFGLGRLLKSDTFDFVVYPYGYMDRRRNIALGNAIASVHAAGKLFEVECDLATHLNAKHFDPIMAHHEGGLYDPPSTLTAYWRDFARVSSGSLAAHWYDFGRGWYQFPGWTDFVQRVESTRDWQRTHSQASVAEVAVILDEDSALLTSPQSQSYGRSIYNTLAYEFDEAGAPWSAFLASDIDTVLQRNFKVIVLLNPVQNASALAEKLRNTSASIVWGYGAGLLENGRWTQQPKTVANAPAQLVEPDVAAGPITYTTSAGGLTQKIHGRDPLPDIRPRIRINDTTATPIGHYADGTVAAASRARHIAAGAQVTDYWLGSPQLDRELLSLVYQNANVHRYTTDGSATYANASSVSVWRQLGGSTQVRLPRPAAEVRDAWSGTIVARNTALIDVPAPENPRLSTAKLYLINY